MAMHFLYLIARQIYVPETEKRRNIVSFDSPNYKIVAYLEKVIISVIKSVISKSLA